MRTIRFVAPVALGLLLSAGRLLAQDRPNVDVSQTAPPVAPPASVVTARRWGAVASWDAQRGVPAFFWADPSAPEPARLRSATTAGEKALAWVGASAALYGLGPSALDAAYVRHVHDIGRGGIVVTLGQRVDGVEVFGVAMKALLDRADGLVAIGGNLHAAAGPATKRGVTAWALGPDDAITAALADALGMPFTASDLLEEPRSGGGYRRFDLRPASAAGSGITFATPARAKRVWFAMPDRLLPAYYLEIDPSPAGSTSSDLWGYVVSAETGALLLRRDLGADDAFQYRVWSDGTAPFTPAAGPQSDYAPHPTGLPDGSSPSFVAPILVSMEGFNDNPQSQPDPWLDPAATESTGNNVDAYADLSAPDGFGAGDLRATTTGPQTFDWTYDTAAAPGSAPDQRMASVTQLFYITNWLHDYFYDSGFDEAAGNAQASNFGRGGVEGDPLHAEAQDVGGMNNANMNTPADGQSPRMQMYLWDGASSSALHVEPGNQDLGHQEAQFGPGAFDVTASLVLAVDGAGADPNDGCEPIGNVAGQVALVHRGNCTFESKVLRAQQGGAVGVLVANNVANGLPSMGEDPATNGVTIGSFGITQADGDALVTALGNGAVTVTMSQEPRIDRDGSIDGDTVAHEWGHYLHHRLVNCGSQQCGAESEGWGDFDALMMKLHAGDDVATGTFALSIYATVSFGDAGYFGIRRFPYTRDMAKNGLTFRHVADGEPLPAGPQAPAQASNFEVHNAGEVWASMMFQAYSSLLIGGGHSFDEAKRRMADYVVAGMKLAPANPTFTEQRDAVLAAAMASAPADFALLAQGFADRGAGTCAVSPARNSNDGSGVVESFELSGQQAFESLALDDSISTCDGDGVLDGEEAGRLTVTVRNTGAVTLSGTTVTVATAALGVTFPNGTTVPVADVAPFQTAVATLDVALDASFADVSDLDFDVTLDNVAACNPSVVVTRTVRVHYDDVPLSSSVEDVESEAAPWATWGAPGFELLADEVWSRDREANGNHRFYGQDFPAHSDTALVSPALAVGAGNFVVTFSHAYDFESSPQQPGDPDTTWDGGLVELSLDGGASWEDVGLYAAPGYDGTIANVAGADNPLADRDAYVGRNPSWPAPDTVTLDFGGQFAGQTVELRFRVGTDAAAGAPTYLGWFIDDIDVSGINNLPFHTVSVDAPGCNLTCVADAGADVTVDEGTLATLDGSGSDPDNDPLTFAWVQTSGPAASLSDAAAAAPSFTAPLVDADTTLRFELTVSDGIHGASDTVDVLVRDVPLGSGGSGGGGGSGGSSGGASGEEPAESDGGCQCELPAAPASGMGAGGMALGLLGLAGALARRRSRRV